MESLNISGQYGKFAKPGPPEEKSKIPSGMAMMLKGFGIDPEMLMTSVTQIMSVINAVDQRLAKIEHDLEEIKELLSKRE